MIAALPIVASVLSVFADDSDNVDLNEVFERAVLLGKPEIFWNHISPKDSEATEAVIVTLIPYVFKRYASLPVKPTNWPWNPVDDHFVTICRILNREDAVFSFERTIVFRVAMEISNRLVGAQNLVALRDALMSQQTRDEVGAGDFLANIHHTESYDTPSHFEFWPSSKGRQEGRILLPFFKRTIRGDTLSSSQISGYPLSILSWDDDQVLLTRGRNLSQVTRTLQLVNRKEVGL